jgi:hypothetical protein
MFLSSGPRLPAEVGSDTITCPMASGSTFPRVELRRCHVFLSSGPHLPAKVSPGAATYPMALIGLWTTGIKKGISSPGTQLGSHVSKARVRVTKALARCADMPLQFGSTMQRRPSWPLLNMVTVVTMFSIEGEEIGQLHAAHVVQDIISYS